MSEPIQEVIDKNMLSQLRSKTLLAPLRVGEITALVRGRLHEVMGQSSHSLALSAAAKATGPIFWAGLMRDVCALRAKGVSRYFCPSRLIQCEAANRREILWCGEEALRCKAAGIVILQMDTGPDLFESRRLQIAAQIGGSLGLVLIGKRAQSSAAHTRWHCSPHPHLPGHWHWRLTKNKSGRLGYWSVCWTDQETDYHAAPRPYDLIARSKRSNTPRSFAKTTPCPLPSATAARPLETA